MRNLEADHQVALYDWAQYHPICKDRLFHIPNGGSRNPIEAKNLKRQGVKKGVSDNFLAYPVPPYHGLWIEMKRPAKFKSSVSKEQADWVGLMNNSGYPAVIAYGVDAAIHAIESYLAQASPDHVGQ